VAQERKQSVIDSGKIDIDRFDVARTNRNRVKVFNDHVGEDIAFNLKLEFQVFLGRVVTCDALTDTQQERPMKD